MQPQKGFSLIELMIVVAIVAVIAAIAIPNYQESVRKSNRSDGKAALANAATLQERFFTRNNRYSNAMADIGGNVSAEGYYNLSVDNTAATTGCAADGDCFVLTATATRGQVNDTGCTTLTLAHTGLKTPAACW
ncbi:type IV pilin protein [Aestuariirhabdus litorea]|uniref:Prepilin-type N-terminal cleavage/methylation domain-containing protein n=1 Tax=Aestuariirhabdus litorea TaxID=2528527 RepID=A0A3P3VHT3_9GAMM|nr:type IV pilin protein [Aestuariirhabdus litorea]RRJ82281.1 prepilin-type N-terminal cleavage/methylation domain-containing protein [Aestuariirhabdus litorea]RWW92447.1 prepilin-type N-terminal cleavage/methylation domain-containing protein [Endozoicomonadaceae bacterium GTF-13]